MNLKTTLAAAALLIGVNMMAQENILDMRENYTIGQTVTVTGVGPCRTAVPKPRLGLYRRL